MNKKIIVKPVDDLTEAETSRLVAELNTIGGFDFVIQKPKPSVEESTSDSIQSKAKPDTKKTVTPKA